MQMSSSLAGRVVLITGAGQGIGRAFAHSFAQAGAISVIADLNETAAKAVAVEIEAEGGKACALFVDVGSADSVTILVREVEARYGRLDVLINNASIFSTIKLGPFDKITDTEWASVLHVNVTGVFYTTRACSRLMKAAKWGRIINISSSAINSGRAGYLHYTTSKSALIGMTRSLARELGSSGITANAVLPGATETEIERETVTPERKQQILAMRSIPRVQTPDDLLGVVRFLASPESAFITGQSIVVDGGNTFL
jgi:3-oxoacyl-[acyl-carrier protein] reductase